jgi:hypothetical protein
MFHIGQRVVCIHDIGCASGNEFPNIPIKGSTYTVRGFVSPDVGYERTPGMLLEEVVNPPWEYNEGLFEPSFHPYHFRPLVQHKTDISVFTRMLDHVRATSFEAPAIGEKLETSADREANLLLTR